MILTRSDHIFIHNYIRSLLNNILRPILMVRIGFETVSYCLWDTYSIYIYIYIYILGWVAGVARERDYFRCGCNGLVETIGSFLDFYIMFSSSQWAVIYLFFILMKKNNDNFIMYLLKQNLNYFGLLLLMSKSI